MTLGGRRLTLTFLVAGVLILSAVGFTAAVGVLPMVLPHSAPGGTTVPPRSIPPGAGGMVWNDSLSWTNVSGQVGAAPACRDSEGLVYDAALGEVVMFGGVSQCGQPNSYSLGDTWAFANGTWANLSASVGTAPSPRWGMAMVYDPAIEAVVLFGGTDTFGNVNNQTWEFNGTWTQVDVNGTAPPALYGAGATYDPAVGGVLLYGGQNGFAGPEYIYNATWVFAGGSWTQLAISGPAPLRSPVLVFDEAANASILFGGYDGTTGAPTNATWSFAGGGWTQLTPTTSPSARFASGATYDPSTGAIVLFGGFTFEAGNLNYALNDTWVFANGTWTNASGSPTTPSARGGPRLVWDGTDGYGLLFGGQSNGYRYQDTWTF
jgi:hypothetical protein